MTEDYIGFKLFKIFSQKVYKYLIDHIISLVQKTLPSQFKTIISLYYRNKFKFKK